MKTPDDYRGKPINSRQGAPFEAWDCVGYTAIEVLPFLNGRPWDEVALAYVHALRPTQLRVTDGCVQLDAQAWRVTVTLAADDKTVLRIEQEVEVGLPDECQHGAALQDALNYGLNSEQTKWHKLPGMTCYDSTGERPALYKLMGDGAVVPFPAETQT